ncbi:TIGR00282 family metallophosphoesterase [Pelagibius litoralis]|uniref:TIGR00282 family metallophosphoesterase n=1 Tax=Pelagibius litoralis TaxID=374515 RepID=A0A967KE08_9PROT|nr:TIGR00282 family metallophosphoesterase [Pelagibius litoralis]NIA70500.1 TIGR00282 family metallophosphoesterase [Pelagibius litoralis]
MRLLFCGDIVGRPGRDVVLAQLPGLRKRLKLDFVIANGENAASGFGITEKICRQLFEVGVDVISGGNHSWDQREVMSYISGEPRLLRPQNFPTGTPGKGVGVFETRRGKKVLVVNVMGQLFMEDLNDPFACLAGVLAQYRLGASVDAVVVDYHAEATSEKMAAGHFVDGKVSLFVGTHTHVPTADNMILPGGTAYQSDAGMCGDYDSVIGMEKTVPIERFVKKVRGERLSVASGEGTLCGVFVETNDASGLAERVLPLRVGGRLSEALPD